MSVVILGGNECMERRYKELCQAYQCRAKIFTKPVGNLRKKIGSPDLIILFTGTVSHKIVNSTMGEIRGMGTPVARCRTSSLAALRDVLENYTGRDLTCRPEC